MLAGLRAREGNRDRRALRGRPLHPARPGAAADSRNGHCRRRVAAPLAAAAPHRRPAGRSARPPIASIAAFDAEFRSSFGYDQPATPLSAHGRHRRGHRRHGIEVRCAPRNAALHSRELHAVHGVHLGLPRHRAAQHLAGSGHGADHGRLPLRRRRWRTCRASANSPPAPCGRSSIV